MIIRTISDQADGKAVTDFNRFKREVSLNSLKEDLAVTHKTVASWVDVLEKFYYTKGSYSVTELCSEYEDNRLKFYKLEFNTS